VIGGPIKGKTGKRFRGLFEENQRTPEPSGAPSIHRGEKRGGGEKKAKEHFSARNREGTIPARGGLKKSGEKSLESDRIRVKEAGMKRFKNGSIPG